MSVWQLDILHHAINHTGLLRKTLVQRGEVIVFWCEGHLHPPAAQGDPVTAWLMTHGLQNTSRSEPPMHMKHNMHKVQSNLLYVLFNCPLNSSDNLRWRQAQVHNTFTRGSCWLAYEVTWSIALKCAFRIVTWMHFLLALHLKKTLQVSTIQHVWMCVHCAKRILKALYGFFLQHFTKFIEYAYACLQAWS